MAKRVAYAGIFIALALIFSYVESLIPLPFGVPGMKLGLANLVIVTGLYWLELADVCVISLVRILIAALLFGNSMSLIYSLSGGFFSLLIMILLKKTDRFSVTGVSSAGGVFHNIGQILMAVIITRIPVLIYYLPILTGVGIATGFCMGFLSGRILMILNKSIKISKN